MQIPRWLYWQWMLLWLVLFGGQLSLALVTLSHISDWTSWLIVLGLCLPMPLLLAQTIWHSVVEGKLARRVLEGDYWVHWTYTEAEWLALRKSSPYWRWYRGVLRVLGLGLGLLPLLGPLLWLETGAINGLDGLAALGALLVIGTFLAFINHVHWRYPSCQAKREVFIGARAVFYGLPDVIRVKHLHQIAIEEEKGHRLLMLICFKQGARSGRVAGVGGYSRRISVPIPQGHEQEARDLMHRFHQRSVRKKLGTDPGTGESQQTNGASYTPEEQP